MVARHVHSWKSLNDPLVARAFLIMVFDDPAGLQVGVDCDCSHILESTLFQIPADSVGQAITDRNRSCAVSVIQDRFLISIFPKIIAEGAELRTDCLVTPGIIDPAICPYIVLCY